MNFSINRHDLVIVDLDEIEPPKYLHYPKDIIYANLENYN